jgi:hypothetical protein
MNTQTRIRAGDGTGIDPHGGGAMDPNGSGG